MSLYLALTELHLNLNLRVVGYAFMTAACMWCFINIKNFHPQKNLGYVVMILSCLAISVVDFLYQFSIIGDQGWKTTATYQDCMNFQGIERNQELHNTVCSVVKVIYYLNGFMYLCNAWSFLVYLVATMRLRGLVNYSQDGNGYRTKLENEVDFDDE